MGIEYLYNTSAGDHGHLFKSFKVNSADIIFRTRILTMAMDFTQSDEYFCDHKHMSLLMASVPQWLLFYPAGTHTHSNQVAQTHTHEALVTSSDFGQLKPSKTGAAGAENCWEENTTH